MPNSTDHTFAFADVGSPACDVAWLWICYHRWARWHLDVMTALTPEFPIVSIQSATGSKRETHRTNGSRCPRPNSARYANCRLAPTQEIRSIAVATPS